MAATAFLDDHRELGFSLRAGERGPQDVVATFEKPPCDAGGDARDRAGILLGADCGRDLADVGLDVDEIVETTDQVGFRPDAVVEGLHRHAGVGGHVLQARRGVPLGGEAATGRGEDVVAGLLGLHRPPSERRSRDFVVDLRFLRHKG